MRFLRKKRDRVLVVGIFQSSKTGRAVLQNLHRARVSPRSRNLLFIQSRLRVEEHGISGDWRSDRRLVLSVALGASYFWERGMLSHYRPVGLAMLLAALVLAVHRPAGSWSDCLGAR